jgi:hypothetical protein
MSIHLQERSSSVFQPLESHKSDLAAMAGVFINHNFNIDDGSKGRE